MRNQTTTIWGAIGKDAVTQVINGKNYAKFSLAVSEGKDKTTWYDCLKLDDNNKLTPYLVKGTKLILSGTLRPSAWVNKEGNANVNLNLWVESLEFLGGGTGSGGKKQEQSAPTQQADDDDLPF